MKKILIATTNPGKCEEIRSVLARALPTIEWLSLRDLSQPSPFVDETGTSLQDNARIKALAYAQWSGAWTLADDSGLFVDALDGKPGVHSARYAGLGANDENNRSKLLEALQGVPREQRTARFSCALALANPQEIIAEGFGSLEGRIHDQPLGHLGFGYDPIVWVDSHQCTVAQMPSETKNAISHRRRALEDLMVRLPSSFD